ncbi:transcriptional regulator, partial [Acinetobacter baumannii]|nr:transcriptional regulator [Acinetobacter baumannii]
PVWALDILKVIENDESGTKVKQQDQSFITTTCCD